MAMTAEQKTDAYRFFAIAFGAAPGATYMSQLNDAYGAGMTTQQIVAEYVKKPQFTEVYPNYLSNAQVSQKLADNVVKSSIAAEDKATIVADLTAALNSGMDLATVIYTFFNNIANTTDPVYAGLQTQLANQVAVAQYYTEELVAGATDMVALRSVISGVTEATDVSTEAAIADAIGSAAVQSHALTTEQDVVTGTSSIDAITGNSDTFNAGDIINGGNGIDKLSLVLNESASAYAGVSISSVEEIDLRSIASSASDSEAVVFSMTDVSGLENLNIVKSTGNTFIEDLQAGVEVSIDDVRGDVTIDFDNQNVPASINVSVNEFGESAGADGQPTLTIDEEVETVNISDDASSATYYNNFAVTGGFSALNVTGGANGTELTVDVSSSAAMLTADFTENESDEKTIGVVLGEDQVLALSSGQYDDVVSIDGNLTSDSTVDVGAGSDTLTTDNIDGEVTLGEGDNTLNADSVGSTGTVTAGAGVDTVNVDGNVAGEISVGAGSDEVTVADDVSGMIDLGDDADTLNVGDDVSGEVLAGAGDDTVAVDGDVGSDGSVDAGVGNDTVSLSELLGTVLGGEGDDTVAVAGDVETTGLLNTGAGNDTVTVGWELDGAAAVDLGEGDDTLTMGFVSDAADEMIDEAATLEGGLGDDTLTLSRVRPNDFLIDGTDNLDGTSDEAVNGENRITGIEHLVIEALNTTDSDSDVVEGEVDLSAFNSDLEDVTIDVQGPEWDDGNDAADVYLANWAGEAITVTSVESSALAEANETAATDDLYDVNQAYIDDSSIESLTTGSDNFGGIEDVTVTVEVETDTSNDTLAVTLAGTQEFDVGIYDSDSISADFENVAIDLADNFSHTIDLGGDFAEAVTVTGGAADTNINLLNVVAASITADIEADVYVDLDSDIDHTITTGAGDDVINANGADGNSDDTVDFNDEIDMGAGTDRLIVSQDMGAIVTENDSLFETKSGIEELQFNGSDSSNWNSHEALLDDDAYATGVEKLVLSNGVTLTAQLGNDFERGIVVDVEGSNALNLENDTTDGTGHYDVTINVDATMSDEDDVNLALTDTAAISNNTVALNFTVGDNALAVDGDGVSAGGFDDINLVVSALDGGVDTITFLDSDVADDNGDISVTLSDSWQDGDVLTINAGDIADDDVDASTGGLTVNVGEDTPNYAINVTGTANSDDIDGTAQGDVINVGAGDDYVWGSDGADTIGAGDGDDEVVGGSGADTITGGAGSDQLFGDFATDLAIFSTDGGADSINGGAGSDLIIGGAGNDTITGGDDSDFVVFTWSSDDSVNWNDILIGSDVVFDGENDDGFNDNAEFNGRDIVTDFALGAEGDTLAFGGATGTGLDSMVNTVNVDGSIELVDSIDLAGAGKELLTNDLLIVSSISVNAEDNSTVAGWLQDVSTVGVVITGDVGSNTAHVWYVDNGADGDGAQITAEDVALVGVITLTGAVDLSGLHTNNIFDAIIV